MALGVAAPSMACRALGLQPVTWLYLISLEITKNASSHRKERALDAGACPSLGPAACGMNAPLGYKLHEQALGLWGPWWEVAV